MGGLEGKIDPMDSVVSANSSGACGAPPVAALAPWR